MAFESVFVLFAAFLMPILLPQRLRHVLTHIPLRWVLVVPFVLQTLGAVALVGYLSYRSGQQEITDLANQLMQEKGERIVQNLTYYFTVPKALTQENQAAITLGLLDWQNTSQVEAFFVKQLAIHPDVSGLMLSTERKDFIAIGRLPANQLAIRERNPATGALENYVANLAGDRLYLQDALEHYDPHHTPPDNPWYGAAQKAETGLWRPIVSAVRGQGQPSLIMAYFLPFTDPQGKPQGVLGASVYLERAGEFLRRLQIGHTGQAFIMDEQGLLIANSTGELPFRQDPSAPQTYVPAPADLQLAAHESQSLVTKAAAAWGLRQLHHGGKLVQLARIRLHNELYFGYVTPFKLDEHVNWVIVLVVPESDFMNEIQANHARTAVLCLLMLGASTALGALAARWTIQPILRLNQASQDLAQGEWRQPLSEKTPIAELKSLTHSFNRTAEQLQRSLDWAKLALSESEDKFSKIFRAAPDAIAINTFADSRYVEVNDHFLKLIGYGRDDIIGRTVVESGLLTQLEKAVEIRQALQSQGIIQNFEIELCTKSGELKVGLLSSELIEIEGQSCILSVFKDYTDRKLAEAALGQSEKRFQKLAANVPGVIYTIVHSPDGLTRLEYVSAAIEDVLEIKPEQALADASLVFRLWHPEDVAAYHTAISQNLETLAPFHYEWRVITPSGKGKWLHAQRSELERRGNGELVGYGVVQDVSDRKRAEAALRESEERFRRAFDDAAIGMAIVALDGQFLQVNSSLCDMLGYSHAELLQHSFQSITHPDDLQGDLENTQKLLDGKQRSYQLEKRYIHKQGNAVWAVLSASIIHDQNRMPLYFVAQIQDISDRHSAERIKDEFIAVVSHELRTPLTGIRGSLGLLASGKLDDQPDKVKHFLAMALKNSDRLVYLINDILDLERLESGSSKFVKEEWMLPDLLNQAVESVQTLAHQESITLHLQAAPVKVWADAGAIVQTLTNLLSNAIKFSSPNTTVTLGTQVIETTASEMAQSLTIPPQVTPTPFPYILFSVKDQGRGIPPEKLEVIFERFQQVDASDSRQKGGTGLGLTISKNIVQQHGGQIWVESVLGEGSTFYFTLPQRDL